MAKRDYAKVQAPSKSDSKANASVLPAIAIVVVAAVCFAGGYWLGGEKATNHISHEDKSGLNKVQAQLESEMAKSRLLQVKIDELQEQVELLQKKARQGAHTKVGDLKFYSELPKQSVTPAPVSETKPAQARAMDRSLHDGMPEVPPEMHTVKDDSDAAVPGAETYKVQIASFKTRADAANMQKKLNKAGIASFVRKVALEGKGEWFRVFVGPYADKENAREAVRDIQEKVNIRGLLVHGD